ncbi:hypothetical protein MACH26_31270 [Planctobacterium marinum]|uniref:Uncharacterized protein n=1 Tax=Planctobacterium marinum TaxID=1631968 RepID=A0AA48KQB9_9ALTE|nr:hypothetical protein MACH26_31270 [Planctobacterium marinum]
MVLVVLVYEPAAAFAGTKTVMENSQLSPEARLIPDSDKLEDPLIVEPEPQYPVAGKAVAASPDNVAFKSLVKDKSVMPFSRSVLRILKSKVIVLPGEPNEENADETVPFSTVKKVAVVDSVKGTKLPVS